MFENILKNFYCDFILLFKIKLSLVKKIFFLVSKYFYAVLSVLGFRKITLFLLGNKYYTHEPLGILGFSIMLKDYYEYYEQPITNTKPIIFDIGANVGNFTIASKIFYPGSTVYAFEPVPKTFSILESNLKAYSDVSIINAACGETNSKMPIYSSESESDRSSFDVDNLKNTKDVVTTEVDVLPLDSFIESKNISKIDLIKIDVEGFEFEVLKGLKKGIKKVDWMIMEVHLQDGGKHFGQVLNFMQENNFSISRFGKIWSAKRQPTYCFEIIFKNNDYGKAN